MGDENKYSNRPTLQSSVTPTTPSRLLTESETIKAEETKKIIEECFPELLPHIKDLIEFGMIDGLRNVRAYRLKPSAPKKNITTDVVRNSTNPIDGRSGFDVLTIIATSEEYLYQAITTAELKNWIACPINEDTTNNLHLTVTMYKPTIL